MNKVTIEFFHDVICSFCFPMSYRMRQLRQLLPQAEIVHRSFALVWEAEEFNGMFGSRAAAKEEILTHWAQANQNDDLHRFNIEAMRRASFPFPTSRGPLVACKAAGRMAGEEAYWDLFDALQAALFTQARDIGDRSVIEDCVRSAGLDLNAWCANFDDAETTAAVERDFDLVRRYDIQVVPTLVVDGVPLLSGAQPLEEILRTLTRFQAP